MLRQTGQRPQVSARAAQTNAWMNLYSSVAVRLPAEVPEKKEPARKPLALPPKGPAVRSSVAAVVLGGGENDSRRLFPLTEKRTLPAIPVGALYRLIDIPLSCLLNSGIVKVYVLTQYNSTSMNRYIQHVYDHGTLAAMLGGFVEVVAATQGPKEQRWAEGAADNVRQWLDLMGTRMRALEDVLIVPSDQIYNMDFESLIRFHRQQDADLTIVCRNVNEDLASSVGCVKLSGRDVTNFEEKPEGDRKAFMSMDLGECSEFLREDHLVTVPFLDERARTWIGSTGIMMFSRKAMEGLFKSNPRAKDFGRELIPAAIKKGLKVVAYNFPEYWVDVGGSIGEYYDFSMKLARNELPGVFEGKSAPFSGGTGTLFPNVVNCKVSNSVLGAGCKLDCESIRGSVIGSRSIIGPGTVIQDSVIMGADYEESEKTWTRKVGPTYPHMGIGANCEINRAIVDKNARIGNNVKLLNKEGVYESMDRLGQGLVIRDGVIVVVKSAVLPDGTQI